MGIELDEAALLRELAPRLEGAAFRRGIANLTGDRFFLAFFLASVSQGEGLGEAAVAMIGQDELAARIRDLERQEAEERGHKERTLDVALELFPEFFEAGVHRHADALQGRAYYVAVLQRNRERLRERGRGSRLNVYLTTTFAYEIMVLLLYRAVAAAVARSPLPGPVRARVAAVLDGILAEEETHVGVVEQHDALLATPRESLSEPARELLDALERLEVEDYRAAARDAVEQVAAMMERYADGARYRAEIESGASAGA